MKPISRSAGFTLLELIVAVGIFAVLALLAYGGLDSVLNTRRSIEQRFERIAQLQKAYMRMRGDFQQTRNRPIRDEFGSDSPALILLPSPTALEFTRGGWRNPTSQPRSSMERVAYHLSDDQLIRSSWRILDRVQGTAPVDVVVLTGVEEIGWRFLDKDRQWQESWPPPSQAGQTTAPPPLAVELSLQTKDWDELTLLFRLGLDP
jgi:general secretion pathway protein J